jgi:zinc/manganese transport system ATP-binding protein
MSAISLQNASLQFGEHKLWQNLNLEVLPGEFVVVLGPNGSGKTSLLKRLLQDHADQCIGYIPQQRGFDEDLGIRGYDLVRFGLDGHKYGIGVGHKKAVDKAIKAVDAQDFADQPLGRLSGGQQQRLRVAQALVEDPSILLCDEPLLSLDMAQQQIVSSLIDERRKKHKTAVLFVTHDINPVLPMVDKVLYLVGENWLLGTPKEILTTKTLTKLYGAPVEVLNINGRLVVLGAEDTLHAEAAGGHHE